MARATPQRSSEIPSADAVLQPFDAWLESQQRLTALALGQWAGWQELWLRAVDQQLDAWTALWRADTAGSWGPWLPMLQRGGEQLA